MVNLPVYSNKDKGIKVAVFSNERGNSISVQKSYKDKKTNEWVNKSISLFPSEAKIVANLLSQIPANLMEEKKQ